MTETVLFMARSVLRVQRYCKFSIKTRKNKENTVYSVFFLAPFYRQRGYVIILLSDKYVFW